MKKAIFFDLDGTLWDALAPITYSWNEAMIKNDKHYRFDDTSIRSIMGLTPEETALLVFNDVPLKEGLELFKICVKAELEYLAIHPGKLYPLEKETLEELSKSYPLYIISNCDKGYIENFLNSLNMTKYFKGHICVGDNGFAKWQNIVYLKDINKFDDVIYIGDTLKDKTESTKANVKFIHANYGFGHIDNDQYFVNKISDLPPLINKLFD
jgi:phosphoglycolate phosphatase